MERLGSDEGCPPLGLPALGSFLWSEEAIPDLMCCDIANRDLLEAVRALAFTVAGNAFRPVDYKNMGSEELGSIYESLLELHPELNINAGTFELKVAAGHERKTTGSYYTPSSLIQCLLDSALDPVLEEAERQEDPEEAILSLKVCDPACGSGHFLIAAAHRMARRLAARRTGDEEPAPEAVRTALRDMISRCIYGVDINPMAVELCKVALWMEALEPGKPLSFLDHHIQCGNSLLGATPKLIGGGIPDDAFKPIEGDDKATVSSLRKQNRKERKGQRPLFYQVVAEGKVRYLTLSDRAASLDAIEQDTIESVHEKEAHYRRFAGSEEYRKARLVADAWCTAFVWRKTPDAPPTITHDLFFQLRKNPESVPTSVQEEIGRLAGQYSFFHWHLAFPDVFRIPGENEEAESEATGWNGGFDVVLGNPPWERIKLQEKEWFAERRPDIANAPNAAARRRMIAALKGQDPALYTAFLEDKRKAEGESHLVRDSEYYPLCGRGDVNTYAIFAELNHTLINVQGRVGCIVPSGIATDDTTKFFFQSLVESQTLVSLFDFENRRGIFPGVHKSYKFCLLTLTGSDRSVKRGTEFAFFLFGVEGLRDEERRFTLSVRGYCSAQPQYPDLSDISVSPRCGTDQSDLSVGAGAHPRDAGRPA